VDVRDGDREVLHGGEVGDDGHSVRCQGQVWEAGGLEGVSGAGVGLEGALRCVEGAGVVAERVSLTWGSEGAGRRGVGAAIECGERAFDIDGSGGIAPLLRLRGGSAGRSDGCVGAFWINGIT